MKFVVGAVLGLAIGWWLHGWQTSTPVRVTSPTTAGMSSVPAASPERGEQLSSEKLFAMLLSLGANDQALAFLAGTDDPLPYRQRLFSHVQQLLDAQKFAEADSLLQAYLQMEFRDVDALLLKAKLLKTQGKVQQALETLYQLRAYEHRQTALDDNRALIDEWASAHVAKLKQARNGDSEERFLQFLIAQEPERLDYVLALATVYVEHGAAEGARHYLSLLAADGRFESQRRALLQQLEQGGDGEAIALQRQGSHFLVSVWLDGRTPALLLIDTGASMTVLRPEVLARAGYTRSQTVRQFNTANGVAEGQVFTVDELTLGNHHLRQLPLVALDLAGLEADGLLGMDILGQYRFQLDQQANTLSLNKK